MYSVKYWCNNCRSYVFKNFTYGHPAPNAIHCPNCGIYGASKCWSGRRQKSPYQRLRELNKARRRVKYRFAQWKKESER